MLADWARTVKILRSNPDLFGSQRNVRRRPRCSRTPTSIGSSPRRARRTRSPRPRSPADPGATARSPLEGPVRLARRGPGLSFVMSRAIAAIVGVAESELGDTDKSSLQLDAQAVWRALEDAGLELQEVDGLATCRLSRFSATSSANTSDSRPLDGQHNGRRQLVRALRRPRRRGDPARACEVVLVSYGCNLRSARSHRLGGSVESGMPTTSSRVRTRLCVRCRSTRWPHSGTCTSSGQRRSNSRRSRWPPVRGTAQPRRLQARRRAARDRRRARLAGAQLAAPPPRLLPPDRRGRRGRATSVERARTLRRGPWSYWGTARRARTWARCQSRT